MLYLCLKFKNCFLIGRHSNQDWFFGTDLAKRFTSKLGSSLEEGTIRVLKSKEYLYNGECVRWLEKKMEIVVAMQLKIKTNISKTYENIFGIVLGWTQ